MQYKQEYDYLFKMQVVGDSGVGKSCLLLRYADDTYTESYISTIGVDFKTRHMKIDGKVIKTQVWDSGGQERFSTINIPNYRGANAIVLVFDVTDQKSFENVTKRKQEIERSASESCKFILVGNKSDLNGDRKVDYTVAKELAQSMGCPYIEASAKEGTNVEEIFIQASREIIKELNKNIQINPEKKVDKMPQVKNNQINNAEPRQKIINALDKYIDKIKKGRGDNKNYAFGFWVCTKSRAINREANYRLAKELKKQLADNPDTFASSIFAENNVKNTRKNIIKNKELFDKDGYVKRKVNSSELNSIIKLALK